MNQRTCENCKCFVRHYVKGTVRFMASNCGHCIKKSSGRYRRIKMTCGDFEEKDTAKEAEKQLRSLTNCLSDMADRLREIQEMLALR